MLDKRISVAVWCFIIHSSPSILILPCLSLDSKEAQSRPAIRGFLASVKLLCYSKWILNVLWPTFNLWDSRDQHPHSWESLSHRLSHCLQPLCLETRFVGQSVSASYTPGRLSWSPAAKPDGAYLWHLREMSNKYHHLQQTGPRSLRPGSLRYEHLGRNLHQVSGFGAWEVCH